MVPRLHRFPPLPTSGCCRIPEGFAQSWQRPLAIARHARRCGQPGSCWFKEGSAAAGASGIGSAARPVRCSGASSAQAASRQPLRQPGGLVLPKDPAPSLGCLSLTTTPLAAWLCSQGGVAIAAAPSQPSGLVLRWLGRRGGPSRHRMQMRVQAAAGPQDSQPTGRVMLRLGCPGS